MLRITPRDHAILRDVWLYRYVTTSQLHRLHFGTLKVAQRRLRPLATEGFVDRFRPGDASSFRTWWYRLTRQGAHLVAESEGLPLSAILPPIRHPRTWGSLAHHALVTDFRVWLREGCSDGITYRFIPSYEEVRVDGQRQRRVALHVPGHQNVLVPDGVFTLEKGDGRTLFMLEVDRDTEPLTGRHRSAIEKKLAMYRDGFDSGAEDRYRSIFQSEFNGFRVLFLVPSETRQRGILRLAAKMDLAPLVWVATIDVVEDRGDLGARCWSVKPEEPPHALGE